VSSFRLWVTRTRAVALLALARTVVLAALSLAGLASVTGCGSSSNGVASKTATEILVAARTAAASASSVHVTSSSNIGREKATFHASLAKDQGHTQLSVLGVDLEVIHTGNTIYIKGNRVFDARLERTLGVKIPSGVWLKGPANGTLKRFGPLASISGELGTILSARGPLTKGKATKIAGQPAIQRKEAAKLGPRTLYVATTGEPYPLLSRRSGRETGQTTFSGWNDPVTLSAPANAVEISQLQPLKGR
jgi:hypothetical protein